MSCTSFAVSAAAGSVVGVHASCGARASPSGAARVLQTCVKTRRVIKQQHRQRASQLRVRAGEGEDVQGAEAAAAPSVPPGWELAQRVSGDAAALLMTGDPYNAELALKKGIAEIQEQHAGDPSAALLHTQLWNLHTEDGRHEEALEHAQAAYDLMLGYFGENSADAAFHGIRLGISLIATGGNIDKAQMLLLVGGNCAQHNLEVFWNRLQELQAENSPAAADLELQTKKLMVALAEANFYGAVGVVRKALQDADEPELPVSELENAWLSGVKQMGMALPPEHPMFRVAQRELGRLIPDAAARPALQEELKGVQTKVQELLYVMKQVQPQGGAEAAGDSGQAPATEEFLP